MATLQEQLIEAQAAYHDLLIGKAVAEFRDQSGEVVRYTQADRRELNAYIADLKAQIAVAAGKCAVGPLRVRF
jgi:hypothetical protein